MKRRCEWNDFFAGIHKFSFMFILIAFLIISFASPHVSLASGTMTDLGTIYGGSRSAAYGINDAGQVVGLAYTYTSYGQHRAFIYSNGVMTDLGTLGGANSWAKGINNTGQVVGVADTSSGQSHAFLYSNGVMKDLGTLGGTHSWANAINGVGQVVGCSLTSSGQSHAFLYSDGVMTDLGTLGGYRSEAYGINNAGQVVGEAYTSSGQSRAFIYSNGVMTDLGTPGGYYSRAFAINDAGQVVGSVNTELGISSQHHAFIYSNGVMTDLGTLGGSNSEARGINDAGQVVGLAETSSSVLHAFLYTPDSPSNQQPIIDSFVATSSSGVAPLSVNLTCSAHDSDGAVASYTINYGDGTAPETNSTGSFTHTYNTAGSYHATCTTVDNLSVSSSPNTITISISAPPPTLPSYEELKQQIDNQFSQHLTYPPYLADQSTFLSQVTTIWNFFTSWATSVDYSGYETLYWAGFDYDSLSFNSLKTARDYLNQGDLLSANQYLEKSLHYQDLSNKSFSAAADVYEGNTASAQILAEGIKNGSAISLKFASFLSGAGIAFAGSAVAADILDMGFSVTSETLLNGPKAGSRELVEQVLVKAIFNEIDFGDGQTLTACIKNTTGQSVSPILYSAIDSDYARTILFKAIKEAVAEFDEEFVQLVIDAFISALKSNVNYMHVQLHSPCEIEVINQTGNVTGLVNGAVVNQIPRSVYGKEGVTIANPDGTYQYKVRGIANGTYGLDITSVTNGMPLSFTATGIPISINGVHQYAVDWELLSSGGIGVTVNVDTSGTGSQITTFTTGNTLVSKQGDLNFDGKFDCSDIAIIKASFGKKSGQAGFDARADVNKDGIIDIRDLSFVSRLLPTGTRCP